MSVVRNALISVYNKIHLDKLVHYLEENNYNIYSTGGTMKSILEYVTDKNIVFSISDYTEYPEICGGRVKTLHPCIFGGILANKNNSNHIIDLNNIGAQSFDLVVVNLYPFETVLQNNPLDEELLLENIDIGGHSLMRAAAKNYSNVTILSHPSQYTDFIQNNICRKELAKQAFKEAMNYDIAINNWLHAGDKQTICISYNKVSSLKYGLNPHMKPSDIYVKNNNYVPFQILNGEPGYINLLDINYAIRLVLEVKEQLGIDCCASFKHNSPAGVSIEGDICQFEQTLYNNKGFIESPAATTFLRTRNIDPKSSFGDIIGYSGIVDEAQANIIKTYVSDGIVAANYTDDALDILRTKKNGKYLILRQSFLCNGVEYRDINGVTLVQPTNNSILEREVLGDIEDCIKNDMILGYITLKYTQSNSVCFVYNGSVIGIGAGQQNRVDCIKIAGEKATTCLERYSKSIYDCSNIILVSDAFLPFEDNVDVAVQYNVDYILQPGGSIRDKDIESACKKYDIRMIYSGLRAFTH